MPKRLKKPQANRKIAAVVVAAVMTAGILLNFYGRAAGVTGDVNNDGVVNVFDLSMTLASWGKSGVAADINNDGTVNVFDLSIVLAHWGATASPTVSVAPPTATAMTPMPSVSPSSSPTADACSVSKTAKLQDIDTTDSEEGYWPRTAGQKVTIYYATQAIPAKYAAAVKVGTDTWSKSPCFNLITVTNCPASGYCVKFAMAATAGDGSTDAEEGGNEPTTGGVRTAADITLYSDLLDKETQNGYTATIVHEMGHSISLVHRLSTVDLMNAETSDTTNPVPDAIDYQNLLVYYGTKI